MSKTLRQWCRNVLDFYAGTKMFNGHFDTSAEMSWFRSVLGPKCPYTSWSFNSKRPNIGFNSNQPRHNLLN